MPRDVRPIVAALMLLVAGCGESDKTPQIALKPPEDPTGGRPTLERPPWATKASANPAAACYVDTINTEPLKPGGAQVSVRRGNPLVLAGWALSGKAGAGAEEAVVVLASEEGKEAYYFAAQRTPRRDVVDNERFRPLALVDPGISAALATSAIAPGKYEINFLIRQGDSGVLCAIGKAWLVVVSS